MSKITDTSNASNLFFAMLFMMLFIWNAATTTLAHPLLFWLNVGAAVVQGLCVLIFLLADIFNL